MHYAMPTSSLPILGLGARSSHNAAYADIMALGNSLGNAHSLATLDLCSVHTVYVHGPMLTNYKVLGLAGSRSVIARIAVDGLAGSILTHHHSMHMLDFIPCGGATLQTLNMTSAMLETSKSPCVVATLVSQLSLLIHPLLGNIC